MDNDLTVLTSSYHSPPPRLITDKAQHHSEIRINNFHYFITDQNISLSLCRQTFVVYVKNLGTGDNRQSDWLNYF